MEKPWFWRKKPLWWPKDRFRLEKKQQIAFYTWESIWFLKRLLFQRSNVTRDYWRCVCVCVCAASVLKNELRKVIQYRKASKKRNAGGQPSTFSKDLKVRKQDFIHFYLCLHSFRRMSSQTNTLLITFDVYSYCKCRKTHCFHTCWLMFPPSVHFLSNEPYGP